jgi:hypothetical protein
MGGYKAPAVILHGCVSIRTEFRRGNSRTEVPISKWHTDGAYLAQVIRKNVEEYVLAAAQHIHES